MLGPHLTLDISGCDKKKLGDEKLIRKILNEFPEKINVRKISDPQIIVYPGSGSGSFDQGGISGFVMFAESHLSMHTFLDQKHASVDIFSCKLFDVDKCVEYFKKAFKAKTVEKYLIMRGSHFPRELEKSTNIVIRQRRTFEPVAPKQ